MMGKIAATHVGSTQLHEVMRLLGLVPTIQNVNKGKRAAVEGWPMRAAKKIRTVLPNGARFSADNYDPKTQKELSMAKHDHGIKCHVTDLLVKGYQIVAKGSLLRNGVSAYLPVIDTARAVWFKEKAAALSSIPWSARKGNHPLDPTGQS